MGTGRVATLVIVALATRAFVACAPSRARLPMATEAGVSFTLIAPEAQRVAVAGSFNQWSTTAHPLTRGSRTGEWTTVVTLPPGDFSFMFVVDGARWITPPAAEQYVDDGFGTKNGIVSVRLR
jgi:1,4-alpha-glucan branching enzyme